MNALSQKLYDFFIAPAPDDIKRMQRCNFGDEYTGTNVDFLIRLYHEGCSILERGDSLVKSFRFDQKDLTSLICTTLEIKGALREGCFNEEHIALAKGLPTQILRIATYHEDKVTASEARIYDLKPKIIEERNKLNQAFVKGDIEALINYYPHAASLLYDDGNTSLPANDPKIKSIMRKQMKEIFKTNLDSLHTSISPIQWFGLPGIIDDMENEISLLSRDKRRNGYVLTSIKEVASKFEECLGINQPPMPSKKNNLVAFCR